MGNPEEERNDGPLLSAEALTEMIERSLGGGEIEVFDTRGDGQHWKVCVVSNRFQGLSTIERHRLVMDAVRGEIGRRMHAIEIKTFAPDEV